MIKHQRIWINAICVFAVFSLPLISGCKPDHRRPYPRQPVVNKRNATGTSTIDAQTNRSAKNNPSAPRAPEDIPEVNVTAPAGENRLNILAWNVESDRDDSDEPIGNDPQVIAQQLKGFKGYHIVALSEVHGPDTFDLYMQSLKQTWGAVQARLSETGREDRLMIAFDPARLELIKFEELHQFNADRRHRSPIAMTLKDKVADEVFVIVNNHLARGDAEFRAEQAAGLREWARQHTLPIIAVGDYNFDYVFETGRGNEGLNEFMKDGIWKWIRPQEWIDSNWYDPEGDGVDNYPGSLLDFAFVAGPAKDWVASCRVITWDGDFPDDEFTSDHRPVELSLVVP